MPKAIAFASKRQKGKRLEILVAQMIRDKGLDQNARRMPGSGAFEGFKGDVSAPNLDLTWECKNSEKVKFWEYFQQAKNQATIAKPPVLVISGNYRPVIACVELETFLNLLLENQQLQQLLEEEKKKNGL